MKLKNVLLSVTSLALVTVIAIGGTLAYLSDRDSEANVFTVGNVAIDLTEDFAQGAELIPGVKIEKEARITNTGDNDAWVWMTLAVPAALDSNDISTVGTMNILHWNVPGAVWKGYGDNANWMTAAKIDSALENGYITEDHLNEDKTAVKSEHMWTICQTADAPVAIQQETIDDVVYNVYTFLYNGKLASGDTTPVALHQVYLDTSVDINTDGQWYSVKNGEATKIDWNSNVNGNPMVYVSAYAMQTNEFASVLDAYKAYNTQWGENGSEYGTPATVVSTADELSAALANGEVVVMTEDIDAGGQVFVVDGGILNGNGNTLIVDSGDAAYESGLTVTEGTAKNLTVAGAFRGLGVGGSGASEMTGDVTYENVTVTGATYGINIGIGNGYKLTMIDCTIPDWNSYSGLSGAQFTGCTFTSEGTYYASQRISANATFTYTNCNFEQNTYDNASGTENYYLDSYGNGTIVFENCYMDGTLITKENVKELFQISPKNNTTVEVNND